MESLEDDEEFTVVDSLPPTTEIEQQEYTKENEKQIKKKNEHVKKVNDAVIKIKKVVAKLITNNNCNIISEKPEKFFPEFKIRSQQKYSSGHPKTERRFSKEGPVNLFRERDAATPVFHSFAEEAAEKL